MKTAKLIAKIVVALAAIAGAVYVVATYGNQIVAWCKKVLSSLPCCKDDDCECCCGGDCDCDDECCCEEALEEAVEEAAEAVEEIAEEVAEADFEN